LEILPGDGTRDFYAHMRSRAVADGAHVDVGQKVGEVDSEGNVTGPHLHFERHNVATGGWSCSVVVNPQPSIDYKAPEPPAPKPPEEPMPTWIRATHNTDTPLQAEVWKSVSWEDVPNGGDFINDGEASIRISGKMYMATLVASFDARPPADNPQATLRTRFVEREKQGDKWVDVEEYTAIEHPFTSGGTVVSDTRVQKVTDGRLLVAQVYAPSGGVLTSANINLLTF
jgi:murein DD-endopeptidase MepM/ murein hydrolase activator NlpD